MVVVTSEGLVRADDREGRSASGDCEGDSNKYEDFFHGRILSNFMVVSSQKSSWNYTTRQRVFVTGIAENYA